MEKVRTNEIETSIDKKIKVFYRIIDFYIILSLFWTNSRETQHKKSNMKNSYRSRSYNIHRKSEIIMCISGKSVNFWDMFWMISVSKLNMLLSILR